MISFALKTGKIVGAAGSLAWSQNHIFSPEDEAKRISYGDLLLSFSLAAKNEAIDITSFGKEIISRFHELYYSAKEAGTLERLKTTLKSLLTEFSESVNLNLAAAVVQKKEERLAGYFMLFGPAKAVIFREGQLVELLAGLEEKIKTTSGWLKNDDLFVLATPQFFKAISLGVLKAALEAGKAYQAVEALAPVIHAREENSASSAIIFKVKISSEIEAEKVVPPVPQVDKESKGEAAPSKKPSKFFSNFFVVVKGLPFITKKFLQDFKRQPNIYIKDRARQSRAKKTTLSVAFILIALLLISVFLGSKRKSVLKESLQFKTVFEEVEYKYQQAIALDQVNPLRERSLLNEAKDQLSKTSAELKDKKEKDQLNQLSDKIQAELEKVAREYRVDSASVFLDLTLVKEGFKGNDWAFADSFLEILDNSKGTILEVGMPDKAAKVAAGGEKLTGTKLIGFSEGRIFALKNDKLAVVDQKKGEVVGEKEALEWGKIGDLAGFSSNAYLLDTKRGKILKYNRQNDGVADPVNYLKAEGLDLEDAVSMTIDGSVWLLFTDGTIVKFTRGVKDTFSVAGLDKEFNQPEKIYTDPDLKNLYVLDRQNTQVVLINKETGEYQAQYLWSGIAGAVDLFASEQEKKILLLTGERIYEIPLRD